MKITIITVCYNVIKAGRKDNLRKCIESVKQQTYKNIEHLFIDGASTDGTVDILKEYADKGYIKYISEKDNGIYDAMQKGVRLASGDLVYFLNTDDYLHDENVISDVVDAFEKYNADAVFGNIVPYLLDKKTKYVACFKPNHVEKFDKMENRNNLLIGNIHHQSIIYKKKIFEKASFFSEVIPSGSDWNLNCQAFLENNFSYKYIDRIITTFGLGGISTNLGNNDIMDEYYDLQLKILNAYKKYVDQNDPEVQNILYRATCREKKFKLGNLTIFRIFEDNCYKKFYLFKFIKIFSIKKEK